MLAKLLPIIFLLVGTGGGIGAGLLLAPTTSFQSKDRSGSVNDYLDSNSDSLTSKNGSAKLETESHGNPVNSSAIEYVKMSNQFVIPVVKGDMITALVVVSLSLETRNDISEKIYAREPKLRDAFLRVLFDHANMGGFHGAFTSAETLGLLRSALRDVAQKEIGPDILNVLIVDIIRQDS